MKKKEASKILLLLLLLLAITFLGIFVFKEPAITGIVTYEGEIKTLNWTFDDLNDFSYSNSLVNISNGVARLVMSVTEHSWNVDNFSEVNIISALEYEPGKKIHNRTDKIKSLDDDSVNINKDDEIFDVAFNKELSNGDIISLYILKSDDDKDDDNDKNDEDGDDDEDNDNENSNINVYLCDNGISCGEPGYGSVNLNGSKGWYNITITGLSEAKDSFNIKPSKNTEFDYIKAVHKDTMSYTSINISYPKSAYIATKEISIASLSSYLNLHKNELLNGQNIGYYYSTDSGSSWNIIPQNNNLSGVPVSSEKIMIKADIAANGGETPIIYDFAVSYLAKICNEDWNATYGACLSNDTKSKYYLDNNKCGTTNNLPADNGTYKSCVYDKPQNPTEILIDARNESNVLINIWTTSNIPKDSISISEYRTNSKNSTPSLKELGKYIDITIDAALKQNLTTITIRIYYTDADIANANLNEETLKIHYYNDTNSKWQVLNSTVNTTGNYVEVTMDHLSTFGIFGDEKEIQNSEQSSKSSVTSSEGSSGGGGGGGKTRVIKKSESVEENLVTTKMKEEIKELEKIQKECDYKISVSIPEHVSFVEHDSIKGIIYNLGGCKIENLEIDVSPELKGVVVIENGEIINIGLNESAEFLLIKKLEANKASDLLIQGFNIKIPKQNVRTYNGILTFVAMVDEQLAFEEKINVKVDLLESPSITSAISSKAAIFLVFLGLFAVAILAFYSKSSRKKSGKLTRGQIGKIEEKVIETEKRYQKRKK